MVTHTRLQQYKRRHGLVCITGLFGCRWHRYQQSTYDSKIRDLLWFTFLVLVFCFITVWLYIWLVGENDGNKIEWFIYGKVGSWFHYHLLMCILTGITAVYVAVVLVLALCHAGHGFQIYMHWIHKLFLLIIAVFCSIAAIFIQQFWSEGWSLVHISLQIIGPFLQFGTVILATILTWVIASQLLQIQRKGLQVLWFLIYIGCMLFIYLCPLLINSPCIVQMSKIPEKPKLFAHRGASAIAPENTKAAFELAKDYGVFGMESDVLVSLDGVPFINHDKTFKRTTNIKDVFPDKVDVPGAMFNISDIEKLNAGSWFAKTDPYRTAGSLTDEQRALFDQQKVAKFSELLTWVKAWNKTLLFDVKMEYMPHDHPYYNETFNITMREMQKSGMPHHNIWWLYSWNKYTGLFGNYTLVTDLGSQLPYASNLTQEGIYNLNVGYQTLGEDEIRYYKNHSISSNIYVINSRWLFSFFWCAGATSTTTDNCHIFHTMQTPDLHIHPRTYLIIWVVLDCVSAIFVIAIFILQRSRHSIDSFNPEVISLQAARHRILHQQNTTSKVMKEKLILPGDHPRSYEQGVLGVSGGEITLERPKSYQNSTEMAGGESGRNSGISSNGTGPHSSDVDLTEVKLDVHKKDP